MFVTIYIETTIRGPAKRNGAGMWLIEYIKKDGTPVTRQGTIIRDATTESILTLECMKLAFDRLTKTCSVRVNTRCEQVLNSIENRWVAQWEKAGWIKANGKPVMHAELWQQVYELIKRHEVLIENTENSYRPAMETELNELRRRLYV